MFKKDLERGALPFFLIVAAVVLTFAPSFSSQFIWDDWLYVVGNPLLKASDFLWRIWIGRESVDFWPISWSLYGLLWRFFKADPVGYHVVNTAIHAGNSALIFVLLRQLKFRFPLAVALLFAVHPLTVDAVVWIFQLKTTLAFLFGLLTVLFYLRSQNEPEPSAEGPVEVPSAEGTGERGGASLWGALAVFFFILCVLTKSSLITLPLVLMVYNFWRGRARPFHLWPYFLVAALSGTIALQWQGAHKFAALTDYSFLQKLGHAGGLVLFYAKQVLWPDPLSFVYSDWRQSVSSLVLVGAWVFLVACGVGLWRYRANGFARASGAALLAYVLLLLPVLGFFDIYYLRFSPASDHWQYHAFALVLAVAIQGLALGAQSLAPWLYSLRSPRLRGPETAPGAWRTRFFFGARFGALSVGLVAVLFLGLSWRHAQAYRNEEAVWRSVLALDPKNSLAHNSLGVWLDKQGRREEGRAHYEAVLAYDPDDVEANTHLGSYFLEKSQFDLAETLLRKAIRGNEESGRALYNLGVLSARRGRHIEAVDFYKRTIVLSPIIFDARNNLGLSLMELGRLDEARKIFEESLQLKPDYGEMRFNYGLLLERIGLREEARIQFREADRLLPNHPVIQRKLANPR